MTSSMTSHATIGNSTFAEPRSADTTMSSIDGPSDFTENMFDYMKGTKKPTTKKSSHVGSNIKPNRKYHLKPEESGIIIETPSEFGEDLTDYTIQDKAVSSPAKNDHSELDGPSDFTANLVEYMRDNKAYSPNVRPSPKAGIGKEAIETLPVKYSVINGNNASSSISSARTSSKQNASTTAVTHTSIEHKNPRSSINKAHVSSARTSPTLRTPPRLNAASPPTMNASPQERTPAVNGKSMHTSVLKSPLQQHMANKTTTSTLHQLDQDAVNGSKRFPQQNGLSAGRASGTDPQSNGISAGRASGTDPQSLPKMNKNLIINGASDFTTGLAAFINGSTSKSASVHTTSTPKRTMRPMSSPAKGQNFDTNIQSTFTTTFANDANNTKKQSSAVNSAPVIKKDIKGPGSATRKSSVTAAPVIKNDIKGPNSATKMPHLGIKATNPKSPTYHDDSDTEGPSDFTENLVEYMKGTKSFSRHTKTSSISTKTPEVNEKANDPILPMNHDDTDIEGPSDFTENLVEYIKGTKSSDPYTKTSSSATIAASIKASEKSEKTSTTTNEAELRAQIAQLQAQLLQKDGTIDALQTSLTHAEKKSNDLQLELNQKGTTIDTLQTTLKQSNQQCQGLEFELHQMKVEVDDLQGNLNDVIINTVQHKDRVINRLHDNNETLSGEIADLRVEIGDKDSMLIDHVEVIRKPQSETDCELLKDALSQYADDLNAQYEISDTLSAEKKELEGALSALQQRQVEMEEREEKREEEWHARAELLMQEIDRRGAACLQLWGQLEHPGERDGRGGQKYTYKYTKKSTKSASLF